MSLNIETPDELTVVVVNTGSAEFLKYDAIKLNLSIPANATTN
jgi:hypothetical protein